MHFTVKRTASFLRLSDVSIFSWLHSANEADSVNAITIVCQPIGHEYMASHRSMRHLTDLLAANGELSLRFDYVNTGNSSDLALNDVCNENVGFSIERSIVNLIEIVGLIKDANPKLQVNAVGFGIGASILLLASSVLSFNSLVVWEPLVRGKRYVRELKALSGILNNNDVKSASKTVEAAGNRLTDIFEQELLELDLTKTELIRANNLLYLHKKESPANNKFLERMKSLVTNVESKDFAGLDKMITYPTETEVPQTAISDISDFITRFTIASEKNNSRDNSNPKEIQLASFMTNNILLGSDFNEEILQFGENNALFGVVTRSKEPANPADLVIFLNCGSEHHVGPHRMYTNFSRSLAKEGICSVRFDIEGVGDSVTTGRNIENEAYSPVVITDIEKLLECVSKLQYKRFIFVGICAGAYHSFIANAKISNQGIVGAIAINPLVFDWNYEKPSIQSQSIKDQGEVNRYKKDIFSVNTWKKIFSGKIRVLNGIKVLSNLFTYRIKKTASQLLAGKKNPVIESLKKIRAYDRKMDIILAKSDPGYEILQSEAKGITKKLMQSNLLTVTFIEGADHGMSKNSMRTDLYEQLSAKIFKQLGLK